MCMTMGIAEAIAIRMIVTANIFAISPASGLDDPAVLNNAAASDRCGIVSSLDCPASLTKRPSALLRLAGEVRACSRTGGNRYLLGLSASGLMPCRHGVVSGWHVVDSEIAVLVAGRIWPFDDCEPTVHPGMDVAL